MKLTFLTAAAFCAATAVFAHEYKVKDITVDHPMIFETAKSAKVAGGYLRLTNTGPTADTLIAVSADFAPRIELHLSETDDLGVARMTKQEGGIAIPAGESVTLQPGGLHVMFMGLDGEPLVAGDKIDATLVFEDAGALDVTFNVEARDADDHKAMDHGEMGHDHDS
ncbi:copper chaperone PCu(A)C [Sulfitobacter albidus]|uniref:Copper chaperone PCu(A)C n=1 Tax=Sulfitobacter albidus TaxID=2829501 RepID=A0A975JBZ4_9RHOB|nr:copper chaperone PCu(A)C [Sulfitobacter albidus]QUJ75628.1 copper chaperone PCu(A)C [Sulfitobacter albidus]